MLTIALNVSNFVTLRLNSNNYPLWPEQILAMTKSQNLVEHLLNGDFAPPEFETHPNGVS